MKPGNILVAGDPDGESAYVCDFGLARHISSVSSLTGERGFVGTIDYVPPEQVEGGSIDGRADVYSLGCVLFECLAGARPFESETELSVVFAHLNEPPPRLSDFRPELSVAFDEVFATALAKSPGDRFSTCGELVGAARRALHGKRFVPRRRRRRRVVAAAALVATVGAAISVVLATRDAHSPVHAPAKPAAALSLRPGAMSLIDASNDRVVGDIGLGGSPHFADPGTDVAFSGDSAWVLLVGSQRVLRVDLATHKATRIVRLPWVPGPRIASGGSSVWVAQNAGPEVIRIDARTGKITRRFSVPEIGASGIAFGAGSLWLAGGTAVIQVDPKSARVVSRTPNPGQSAAVVWLAYADGAVWSARASNGIIRKIDPVQHRITAETQLHGWISDLNVGGGLVWASVVPDSVVYKLSEDDLSVQGSRATGPDPERISFGGGRLWIANTAAKTVSLLDEASGGRSRLASAAAPTIARYHSGLVWTGAARAPRPLPPIAGSELRISLAQRTLDPDPARAHSRDSDQLEYATCANLLIYPDVSGPAGQQLRPEVAAAMPTVSRDRRTYKFRIRPDFRFSPPSNEAVTADTFRYAIERALSPKLGQFTRAAGFASDIAGLPAYRAGKAAHISGLASHGATLSITLVKPAGDFLTRISASSFCPVPFTQGLQPNGPPQPIASAGPYYTASVEGDRTVLLRNPNYAGSRPRRATRIVYTEEIPTPQAVSLTDRGSVAYLPGDSDNYSLLAVGGPLDQRYGAAARAGRQRYFLEPIPFLDGIVLNARRPLFHDLRLRRAVNYALDRPALAAAFYDTPADGIVPPAVPGFAAGRVYPTDGPDLRIARRLEGGRSRRAVLFFCTSFPYGDPALSRIAVIVRSDLARIRVAVSIVESQQCPSRYDAKVEGADLLLFTNFGDPERDPEPFLDHALAVGRYGSVLGPGPWSSPAFRQRVDRARVLLGQARTRAYAGLEEQLMRAAPFAVYGSYVSPEYFAPGVGCKVFQPALGFVDLGALCVRKR